MKKDWRVVRCRFWRERRPWRRCCGAWACRAADCAGSDAAWCTTFWRGHHTATWHTALKTAQMAVCCSRLRCMTPCHLWVLLLLLEFCCLWVLMLLFEYCQLFRLWVLLFECSQFWVLLCWQSCRVHRLWRWLHAEWSRTHQWGWGRRCGRGFGGPRRSGSSCRGSTATRDFEWRWPPPHHHRSCPHPCPTSPHSTDPLSMFDGACFKCCQFNIKSNPNSGERGVNPIKKK